MNHGFTLTALAKASNRIRLGTIIICNSYTSPMLLAKMSSTFDVVTRGRMELGLGAGWYEKEYIGYGYEFPSNATRIKMLEETAIIVKGVWTEDEFSFRSKVLFEKTDELATNRLKQLGDSWKLSSLENFSRSNPVGSPEAVSEFL